MDIDSFQAIRTISIASNKDLLEAGTSEGGREIKLDSGVVISAEFQMDEIALSATDSAGQPLDLYRLSLSLDSEQGVASGERTFLICYEDPATQSTQCVPMKCGTTVVIVQPPG